MWVGGRVVLALALWGGSALAKEVSVTLQDGTELHGELVERKPKDHLIIKLPTGEVRRLEWSEIKQVDEPVTRVEVAPPPTDKVEVIIVSDRPHVRLEVLRSHAEPDVALVGGGTVSTFNPQTGLSTTRIPGTAVPTTKIVETWHPVCNAPCNQLVDADLPYRLTGDDVVTSGKFVIEKQSAVRVKATMGSTGERGGAVGLIVFGVAHLVATGILITFGAIMTPGLPGEISTRDVLYATSGIVAGASLFAFVPAIMMWSHSASKVELEPATASNDWGAAPSPSHPRFSRDAAAAALSRATDKARADCRTDDGITGQGHLKVTFAPSGEVSNVEMEPPYAGTPTGDCVEKSFRRANVPAFEGEPVTVGKTFTIGE